MIEVVGDQKFFFVGDIHGNFDNLMKSINKNGVKEDDCLVFLGDLINKGSQSLEVLNFVKNWKNKIIIIGNHERVFIDHVLNYAEYGLDFLMNNGGKWMHDVPRETLVEFATFLVNNSFYFLDFKIDDKVIGCCHASVPFDDWDKMKLNFKDIHPHIIWSFERFNEYAENKKSKKIKNIDGVIFGHVPVKKITKVKNSLYIDTGSFILSKNPFTLGDITMLEIRDAKKKLFK